MPSSGEESAVDGRATATRAGAQTRIGGSPRELVVAVQRKRIMDAAVQLIAERGLRQVTTQSVARRAGVSRRTLNTLFGSMDDCAVAALAQVRHRVTSLVSEAFWKEAEWTDRVLAGLAALLDFLDREPELARVCLVEALAVGPAGLSLRARELEALAPLVDAGRVHATPGELPHALMPEATIAAVAGILHMRLVTGKAPPFIDLLAPLASVVLSPYLGTGRSLQEAHDKAERLAQSIAAVERPPRPPSTPARAHVEIPKKVRNPNAYRVRLSLLHLANHRGASNAEIARAIGVLYASQISALLTRLERDGLLAKRSRGMGHSSEWWLTSYGESVAQALADEHVTSKP
jgi:AcrR family transcriptional regulator